MPSRIDIDFDDIPCGSIMWVVTEEGNFQLAALDPKNNIFAVEHPDGRSIFCFLVGSSLDGTLKIGKICSGYHFWAISGGIEFTSPKITAIRPSSEGLGIALNIFARAAQSINI
jgi:hypothetical protein